MHGVHITFAGIPNDTCHAYCFIITCKNYTSFSTSHHTGFLHIYFASALACFAYRGIVFCFVRIVKYFTQHIIFDIQVAKWMFYINARKNCTRWRQIQFKRALYLANSLTFAHIMLLAVFSHYTHHFITVFFPFSLVTQHPQKKRMKEKTSHLHPYTGIYTKE